MAPEIVVTVVVPMLRMSSVTIMFTALTRGAFGERHWLS